MSKSLENTIASPSFWRWLWKGSGEGRTVGQMGFMMALAFASLAASIPLWYWLVAEYGGGIGDHPADPILGINIATPGPIVVMVTVGACRPDDLRSYLLTGFAALLAGLLGQAGMATALAITFSQGLGVGGMYMLAILLTVFFVVPAIGVMLAASYFLGWRRVMAG